MIKIVCRNIALVCFVMYVAGTQSFGQCKADFRIEKACEGDSVIFINLSQNSNSYIWRFGDGTISTEYSPKHFYSGKIDLPNATLVALNSNGCADSITKPVFMDQKPDPDFKYSVRHGEIIFVAIERFATKYKWYFATKDSTIDTTYSFTYLTNQSGIDTVCLYLENAVGCYDDTCKLIDLTVGVEKPNNVPSLEFYPNPSTGQISIVKPGNNIYTEWEVIDQFGKIVKRLHLPSQHNTMDLNLPAGIYFLKDALNGWILNRKLVVIK